MEQLTQFLIFWLWLWFCQVQSTEALHPQRCRAVAMVDSWLTCLSNAFLTASRESVPVSRVLFPLLRPTQEHNQAAGRQLTVMCDRLAGLGYCLS